LSEYDTVAITVPPDVNFRDACFKCKVIAISGLTAALEPISRGELLWLPEKIEGAFMTFRHERSLVALKGTLCQATSVADMRFRVSDGVHLPRRRASRTEICMPIALRLPGDDEDVQGLTVNLGGDGLVVESAIDVAPGGEVEMTLSLPGSDEPVEARAHVLRAADGLLAIEVRETCRAARGRLARFVVERNRAALHRRRLAASEFDF
jgi:hypothetical protein